MNEIAKELDSLLDQKSLQLAKTNISEIDRKITNQKALIFGSGNLGRKIESVLRKTSTDIVGYSDNNEEKWGQSVNDLVIFPPAEIISRFGEDIVCIVSIWSPNHSFKATKDQLSRLGVKNIIHAASIMLLFPDVLLPHYHFQTPEFYFLQVEKIKKAFSLLKDDASRSQYVSHIRCRLLLDFENLPVPEIDNQYFPEDLIKLTRKESFLDAGAYIGDTLNEFVAVTGGEFHSYYALEPDPENLKRLQKFVSSTALESVVTLPFAVGARNELLKFNATGGGGAALSSEGEIEVECKRIDDLFTDTKLTFLKFDIEGAELDALLGASHTITTNRPVLAVCIYHLPDDIWNIPLHISEYYPFYDLYVRTHQFDGLDFVLYAIPR